MKKLLIVTAVVSALAASTLPAARAADAGDVAAGALVGGVLGYAIGQSSNGYNAPYYGYSYNAPYYGYGYTTPGYGTYYGYETPVAPAYGVNCAAVAGNQVVTDQSGNAVGVQCPDGTIQYYNSYGY